MHWSKNINLRDNIINRISNKLKGRISPRKGIKLSSLIKAKISLSKTGIPNLKRRAKVNEKQVCNEYINGDSSCILSKRYKIDTVTICNILKRNNIIIRNNQEKTLNAIKKGRSSNSELQRKKASINWSGENNPRWSGGRYKNSHGYVLTHDKFNRYRKEHRIVVEEILGRELKRSETIHHIDYNKQNNNPENLYYFENDNKHKSFHGLKNKPILKSNLFEITIT